MMGRRDCRTANLCLVDLVLIVMGVVGSAPSLPFPNSPPSSFFLWFCATFLGARNLTKDPRIFHENWLSAQMGVDGAFDILNGLVSGDSVSQRADAGEGDEVEIIAAVDV